MRPALEPVLSPALVSRVSQSPPLFNIPFLVVPLEPVLNELFIDVLTPRKLLCFELPNHSSRIHGNFLQSFPFPRGTASPFFNPKLGFTFLQGEDFRNILPLGVPPQFGAVCLQLEDPSNKAVSTVFMNAP